MIREQKVLLIRKIVAALFLLLGIAFPFILTKLPPKRAKLLSNEGSSVNYYERSDHTTFEITFHFDIKVRYGTIDVTFFDKDGNSLGMQSHNLYVNGADSKDVIVPFDVDGKAVSYQIDDYYVVKPIANIGWAIAIVAVDALLFYFFATAMVLSTKVYKYNGHEIVIYVGRINRYIKVDGDVVARYKTIFTSIPLKLSCTLDDGTLLTALVNKYNRITLFVNAEQYDGK